MYIHLHVKCTCTYIFVLNVQLWLHVKRRCVLLIFSWNSLVSNSKKWQLTFLRACHGQVVSHRPLTTETRVRFRASPWERSGRQSGIWSEFSPSTSACISVSFRKFPNSSIHSFFRYRRYTTLPNGIIKWRHI
jgi:hypothetical protein